MARLVGPVAAGRKTPCIGHLRDIMRLSATATRDLGCNSCLLAVSNATRNWYLAAGLPADSIHVLYNGVDLDQFAPRQPTGYLHRELSIPRSSPLIGSIGQIALRKGYDVWLSAADRVLQEYPSHRILIVGQRHSEKKEVCQLESRLRLAANRAPLAGRTFFLGRRNDVHRFLNELTLLVHPARQEPLGRVLLESAASGIPIVATDVGGTSEIFPIDENAACLVPAGDPQQISRATIQLLSDDDRRRNVGAAARRIVEARFGARQASQGLVKHYQSVLENASV
jgi:glycosyltransferase involved in cell wall biosynthesis